MLPTDFFGVSLRWLLRGSWPPRVGYWELCSTATIRMYCPMIVLKLQQRCLERDLARKRKSKTQYRATFAHQTPEKLCAWFACLLFAYELPSSRKRTLSTPCWRQVDSAKLVEVVSVNMNNFTSLSHSSIARLIATSYGLYTLAVLQVKK